MPIMVQKVNNAFFLEHKNEMLDCLLDLNQGNNEKSLKILDNMSNFIDDGTAIVFVSLENNVVNGFIWGYFINKNTIHVNYFVVLKQFRNRGIGRMLLKKLIYSFENTKIELLVYKNNINSIRFYENFGFQKQEYNDTRFKMILEY